MFSEAEIAGLKTLYPEVAAATEGGVTFLFLGKLSLPEGVNPRVVDGLLCPSPRDNYQSRLFLSERVTHQGKGQNWNGSIYILGRTWSAVSWTTRAGQTLSQMVLDHLGAFRA